jgi:hypothetical protein
MGGIFSSITDFVGIDIETVITVFIIVIIIYIFLRKKTYDSFQDIYASANPDIGVQPLILKNTEELPIIPIRTSPLGKAGYFTANCIRKLVYPVDPLITYTDQNKLLADLKADELAIVREQEVLSSVTRDNMPLHILAPLFYEYILCMTDKYSELNNISELTKLKKDGRNNIIGVLSDSLALFKTICKNRNLHMNLKDSSFIITEYKLESELFIDFGLKKLDAVFLVTHPKDTILQTYCNDNTVRFLELEPSSARETKPEIPFNPEDENDLDEFKTAMKRDVPWLFSIGISIDKIPNASLSSVMGASRATGNISIQRHVYNTYKVRSLLCYKQLQSSLILAPGSKQLQGLATRLIRQYQTIQSLFNKWNPVRGNDTTADSTDIESFSFDELASISKSLQFAEEIKQELKHVGLVKFDDETLCAVNNAK